ncbi:MAG TPA: iron-containing alcohol dehydrogenase [Solirubrobacterales bacterium]|nr:iron-containing alcohol dehydrogenase [Solirubrobacterales bacterium]
MPEPSPEILRRLDPPAPGQWLELDDGRRTLRLYAGGITDPVTVLAGEGWDAFELLSTSRAVAQAGGLAEAAERVHLVPAGPVPAISAAILAEVGSDRLVALGGGRVIDSAKAIAAVGGGEVAAIPTTLSGAPMTAIHRLPEGRSADRGVRPSLVIAYADAMTSAPEPQLRATAMNALAHGAESLYTPLADSLSGAAALRGAELLATALDAGAETRNRAALALGSLLCGLAVDRAGIAIHHVIGQTVVRVMGTPHAETYAALLPQTIDAMRERAPDQIASLAAALGAEPAEIRGRIADLGGDRRLGELDADRDRIDEVLDVAMARPELSQMTPGEVDREDLRAVLEASW